MTLSLWVLLLHIALMSTFLIFLVSPPVFAPSLGKFRIYSISSHASSRCSAFYHYTYLDFRDTWMSPCFDVLAGNCPRGWGYASTGSRASGIRPGTYTIGPTASPDYCPHYCFSGNYYPDREGHYRVWTGVLLLQFRRSLFPRLALLS